MNFKPISQEQEKIIATSGGGGGGGELPHPPVQLLERSARLLIMRNTTLFIISNYLI